MRDELFDRDYQAGRAALNDGIDGLARRMGNELAATFRAVHRIQWSAPWTRQSR